MPSNSRLSIVDREVAANIANAQLIVNQTNGTASPALQNLNAHANNFVQVCIPWSAKVSGIITNPLNEILQLGFDVNQHTMAYLHDFSTTFGKLNFDTNAAWRAINQFNSLLNAAVANLNGDVLAIQTELATDKQEYERTLAEIDEYNQRQSDPGYVVGEIFKGIVSAGIWPAVDLDNAQKEADSLNSSVSDLANNLNALGNAQRQLGDLLSSIAGLASGILNLSTATGNSLNKLQTAMNTLSSMPSPDDGFFSATMGELQTDLSQLRSQADQVLNC